MLWQGDGQLFYWGSPAWKYGGGSWWALSDRRIKTVKGEFTAGLDEIRRITPCRYSYTKDAGPGVDTDQEFVGLVAQDVEDVIPGMVVQTRGKIGERDVEDLRGTDTTPLWFAMLNAIKQLDQRLTAQEGHHE
jgi:hypothetical protein